MPEPDEFEELSEAVYNDEPATFQGTRYECLAWLDSYFGIQRSIVEGALAVELDRAGGDAEAYEKMLDVLSRSVYEVSITPLGMVTKDETRPENAYRAMRIQTALELFDAITSENKRKKDDKQNS